MLINSKGLLVSKDLVVISKIAMKVDFDQCPLRDYNMYTV